MGIKQYLENFWHEWRGSNDGRPSMLIHHLWKWRDWRIDLHKFIRADDFSCFHTHNATAFRLVLWGGYAEEIHTGDWTDYNIKKWRPLCFGLVRPELCHRVDKILNGKASYSLWIRGPKSAEIEIRGVC